MESLLVWGLALLGVALVLLAAEFFAAASGALGLTASALALAGIICLFKYDTTWGLIGCLLVIVLGPATLFFGFKLWPHTPVGRRVIGAPTEEEQAAARAVDARERERKAALIGADGMALTDLRPVGVVEIRGERHDALAETLYIPAGTRVRVIGADASQVRVRQAT